MSIAVYVAVLEKTGIPIAVAYTQQSLVAAIKTKYPFIQPVEWRSFPLELTITGEEL